MDMSTSQSHSEDTNIDEDSGKITFLNLINLITPQNVCSSCVVCNKIMITLTCFLIYFNSGVMGPIFGPTITLLAEFYNTDVQQVSAFFIIKASGMGIGIFIMGPLIDVTTSPRNQKQTRTCCDPSLLKILFAGIVSSNLSLFLIPFIPWFWSGGFLAFCIGFGDGSILLVLTTICKVMWPLKVVFPLLQLLYLCGAIGATLGPLFIGVIFEWNLSSKVTLIIIYSVVSVVGIIPFFIICFYSPRKSQPTIRRTKSEQIGKQKESEKVLQNEIISSSSKELNNNKSPSNHQNKKANNKIIQRILKKIDFFRIGFIFLGTLSVVFFVGVDGSFQSILFYFLREEGWNKSNASFMNSVYFLSYGIGRALGVFQGMVLSPTQVFFIDLFGITGTLVILLFLYSMKSSIVIILGVISMGFFCSTGAAAVFTMPNQFGIPMSALELSLMLGFASFGFIDPTIITILIERFGNVWFLITILIVAVCSLVIFYFQFALGHVYLHIQRGKKKKNKI